MTEAPPALRHDRCETCEHWNIAEKQDGWMKDGSEMAFADCRARPPQLVERNGKPHTAWPRLRAEQWCGGWKKRRVTKGEEA